MIIASRVRGGVHNRGSPSTQSLKTILLNGRIVVPVVNVFFLISIVTVVVVCVINHIIYVAGNGIIVFVAAVVTVVIVAVFVSICDVNFSVKYTT